MNTCPKCGLTGGHYADCPSYAATAAKARLDGWNKILQEQRERELTREAQARLVQGTKGLQDSADRRLIRELLADCGLGITVMDVPQTALDRLRAYKEGK